jgi:hypothetical protein
VLTWGGLALEASLALILWLPAPGVRPLQHGLLLAFCLLTYAVAPVAGFGWLLLVMGLCLCAPHQRLLRATYTAMFIVVLVVTEVPWASLLLEVVRAGAAVARSS